MVHEAALGAKDEGPESRTRQQELPVETKREHTATPSSRPLVLLVSASRAGCPPALQLVPDSSDERPAVLVLTVLRKTAHWWLCQPVPAALWGSRHPSKRGHHQTLLW